MWYLDESIIFSWGIPGYINEQWTKVNNTFFNCKGTGTKRVWSFWVAIVIKWAREEAYLYKNNCVDIPEKRVQVGTTL